MKSHIFIIAVFLFLGSFGIYAAESPPTPDILPVQSDDLKAPEVQQAADPAAAESKQNITKEEKKEENAPQQPSTEEEQPPEGEGTSGQIADPLYPWNNAMYHFNDKLYFWVMKPVAKEYSAVFPQDIRVAVSNFFHNLRMPIRFVSNLLQLKLKNAGSELLRFVYNSTAGVGGLADVAKTDLKVSPHEQDLGLTFGYYGIGNGFYIVWPFLGPSTLRDTVGMAGDGYLDPVSHLTPWYNSTGASAYDKVNETSLHIGEYEDLKESAIDPYAAIRNAYVQHRQSKIKE
jgi:phospholipid-binding lipoprotein MlaA